MRLTKSMLDLIYAALVKYENLTEKSEEDEALVLRAQEWVLEEMNRRESRKTLGK